jgi:UDP-4-amino-4,6-dideoxy-N-acetyl-beta-L-altrosamine N-acetyltransferase
VTTSLRPLEESDAAQVLDWRNRSEVSRWMYTDHTITPDEHARWIERVIADDSYRYWIMLVDETPVGLVGLYDIDRRNRRCVWAFYIAEDAARGKGVGSFVEYEMLRVVFDELELNKLCCEVIVGNEPVKGMHESFGFKSEGVFRQHYVKSSGPVDIYCLAMLKEEWLAERSAIEDRLRAKGILPAAG